MVTLTNAAEVAAVAGLAVGGWFYAALYPTSQIFGRVVIAGNDPGEIALTYDDGPNPLATPKLLDTLARENVTATFFLIGDWVKREPALVREIAAAGHTIGNHTMTHPWLSYCGAERVRREIRDSKAIIEDTIGAQIRLFRPPHGARKPVVFEVARELRLATVNWNVLTYDWLPQQQPQRMVEWVRTGVKRNRARGRGTNVLMHDGGLGQPRMHSVIATETIIADAKALGMKFVTPQVWV
ncbi:peptidoglycan/xylan/chitin deacetylase (PgdA/CDA1 family) [Granulicella aggregans]|uniref:Peptidoglycan/xylan/chitin deacetylase (PgdA/CDA1 family) n=1 Tax=Granulicella aggregans TaxID=474949 RepID=A0A7W7ZES3_9BACT|nr:polysaccharide deacetylase family protein [Granulicella aggregans]MBB5058506.1 peptidoglycan/xylan/chitin deacetylase (PgdA/CDA1 family) [Granulicella aggregans]